MSTIEGLYMHSLLAEAAYADLVKGKINDEWPLKDVGMGAAQASDFASKWTVVDQYNDTSGISATVFQEIATGTKYLAIRGTQPTDIGDIAADYILASGFPSFLNPQFIQLSAKISDWLATGILPNQFTVTGHSLGGYLAAAVDSAFHANVSHAYTYNAPGLAGASGNVFDAFRAVFGLSDTDLLGDITNVRGTAGISSIAGLGLQLAAPVMIETELTTNPVGVFDNHSIVGLTDSLAIQNIFAMLDPAASTATLNGIIKACGSAEEGERENTLDAIRNFFGLTDATPIGNHEAFWANLVELQNSTAFTNLIGKVTLAAPPTSASEAHADFGAFLSLVYLTPFALKPNDITANVLLQTSNLANTELALSWEQDKLLTPAQFAGNQGHFSTTWLEDRAQMLSHLAYRNATDSVAGFDDGSNQTFQDIATEQTVSTGDVLYVGPGLPLDSHRIIFGNDGDNINILGGNLADHLYGGAGNDYMNGGNGDDLFIGGSGNDIMEGGGGSDAFYFDAGFGQDVILLTVNESGPLLGNTELFFAKGVSAKPMNLELSEDGSGLLLCNASTGDRVDISFLSSLEGTDFTATAYFAEENLHINLRHEFDFLTDMRAAGYSVYLGAANNLDTTGENDVWADNQPDVLVAEASYAAPIELIGVSPIVEQNFFS